MSKEMSDLAEVEMMSKEIQLKLLKGELEWEDEMVQFFIPVALFFTNFDWLKLLAEHNLVEEDEKVVKNFLEMVQALMKINATGLEDAVNEKIGKMLRGL